MAPRSKSSGRAEGAAGSGGEMGMDDVRKAILAAALQHVPFDGWTDKVIAMAAREAGVDEHRAAIAFPDGAFDMVRLWCAMMNEGATARIKAADLPKMKVRERVRFGVAMLIEEASLHRIAVRRAAALFALPGHTATGARIIYEAADAVWRAIGDTSTDFNYYSKRAILSGVISSTMMFWFSDDSEDYADTQAFLDRRIGDVMQIEKAKAAVGGIIDKLPDPFGVLARLRYPGRGV